MRDILSDFTPDLSDPDPVRRSQIAMKKPLAKRFYKEVAVLHTEDGFAVQLDGRTVKTPARNALAVPTETLAEMIAAEWHAQVETIDPLTMPVTRLVNTALDGIAADPRPVFEDIIRYAGIDLLCYRAETPQELVQRQADAWDPVLDRVAAELGARFILIGGIMHQDQPAEAIAGFERQLGKYGSPLQLACLHTMTSLTGSAILALAFTEGYLPSDKVWSLAHVDEDWGAEKWGSDAEAEHRRALRFAEFTTAVDVFSAASV